MTCAIAWWSSPWQTLPFLWFSVSTLLHEAALGEARHTQLLPRFPSRSTSHRIGPSREGEPTEPAGPDTALRLRALEKPLPCTRLHQRLPPWSIFSARNDTIFLVFLDWLKRAHLGSAAGVPLQGTVVVQGPLQRWSGCRALCWCFGRIGGIFLSSWPYTIKQRAAICHEKIKTTLRFKDLL